MGYEGCYWTTVTNQVDDITSHGTLDGLRDGTRIVGGQLVGGGHKRQSTAPITDGGYDVSHDNAAPGSRDVPSRSRK